MQAPALWGPPAPRPPSLLLPQGMLKSNSCLKRRPPVPSTSPPPGPLPHRGGCGGSARAGNISGIAPCPTSQPRGDPGGGARQGRGRAKGRGNGPVERSEPDPKLHTHPALLSPHHYARDWAYGGKHMPARALRAVQTARFCCDLPSARALPAGCRRWCFIHLFPLPPRGGFGVLTVAAQSRWV